MDTGISFSEMYTRPAFENADALITVIDRIDNVMVLGNGIFSHWRYITHWIYSSLIDDRNREWFPLAFGRLATLTSAPR